MSAESHMWQMHLHIDIITYSTVYPYLLLHVIMVITKNEAKKKKILDSNSNINSHVI